MKRVFIVHGWGGNPQEAWLPWLKRELEKKKFDVRLLTMPNPEKPTINEWVSFLAKKVGVLDSQTYFVGHSIGCQTILRYLENATSPAGGAVFVAGWLTLTGLDTDEDKLIAKEWLTKPINFDKIKKISRIAAIFSDDDPFVPLENVKLFEQKLASSVLIEHKKGHIDGEIRELPNALNALLELAKD